jgi:hypothetical protein
MAHKPIAVVGLGLLLVAALNADYTACAPGEPVRVDINADGSSYVSCDSTDPVPFLVAGLTGIALAGVLGATFLRRESRAIAFGVVWLSARDRRRAVTNSA